MSTRRGRPTAVALVCGVMGPDERTAGDPAPVPALFAELEPGLLLPQPASAGPHDPDVLAGGAIAAAAVMLSSLADVASWRLARVSADFLRPAVRKPLWFSSHWQRQGRRIAVNVVTVTTDGLEVASVRLLWLSVAHPAGPSASRWPLSVPLIDPQPLPPITPWHDGFFGGAVECRTDAGFDGIGAGWCLARLVTPVIAGRDTPAVAAAVAVADIAHGVGALVTDWPPALSFVNPDLTVSLARDPEPGWLRLDVDEVWPGDHTGLAVTRLTDAAGPLGVAVQAQTLTGPP